MYRICLLPVIVIAAVIAVVIVLHITPVLVLQRKAKDRTEPEECFSCVFSLYNISNTVAIYFLVIVIVPVIAVVTYVISRKKKKKKILNCS